MRLQLLYETKTYKRTGSEVGPFYHAGKTKINKIDPDKLGSRDEGWYGVGFYVDEDPEYVKEWYGPKVTKFEVNSKAKVLWACIDGKDNPSLFKAVMGNERKLLKARKALGDAPQIVKQLKANQVEWVHAVDRYAEENKYDIVRFNSHEIVVKNLKMIEVQD